MEKTSYLELLYHQLDKMNEHQKVDVSVVETIDKIIKVCQDTEEFWMTNESIPIENAFLLYHASRNVRLVFEKMKERFIVAEEKHENPGVVTDSLKMFPLLNSLCYAVFSLRTMRINSESMSIISQRLRLLRKMALETSMFPSPEEELKELDKSKLKKCFKKFTNSLQAMFVEI